MKDKIHPQYFADAIIRCSSCGTEYQIGSTKDSFTVAICAKCHPFYTGNQQVVVDTANKISAYKEKLDRAAELKKRKEEIEKQRAAREKSKVGVIGSQNEPRLTLRDLMKGGK